MTGTKVPLHRAGGVRHHPGIVSRARTRIRPAWAIPLVVALLLGPAPAGALGRGGGPEVRASGVCGAGATARIRLRGRDGAIRVRFEVDHRRAGERWRVVLIQDRRVAWRGTARTAGARGAFEVERVLRDLPGGDQVSARAWGPHGLTCTAGATLAG